MNQKGISSIAIVLIGALIVLLAGGYFLIKSGKTPLKLPSISQSLQRVTEKDFEFIKDPNLRKHLVAQTNQAEYRVKSYSSAADLTFATEVQIRGEDFNTREIQYGPKDKEMKHKVEIANTIYVKDYSDGKWWKQTIKTEEEKKDKKTEEEKPIDFKEEYSKTDLKFKFLGKEACGNMTCFKYQQNLGEDGGLATTRIFWFDDREYLLRKEEAQTGEFKTTIEYSYDGINIIAPSPTKDVPEGKNIYDYYYGTDQQQTPSNEDLKKYYEQFNLPQQNPQDFETPAEPDTSQ